MGHCVVPKPSFLDTGVMYDANDDAEVPQQKIVVEDTEASGKSEFVFVPDFYVDLKCELGADVSLLVAR
jgi:hypothetical protein